MEELKDNTTTTVANCELTVLGLYCGIAGFAQISKTDQIRSEL